MTISDNYVAHPFAELFPLLPEEQLAELAEDIKANGLNNPGVLHEGKILDGRNRYEACKRAGLKMGWTTLAAGTDPLAYVISQNLRRRDLTTGQRAMVAGRIANLDNGSNQHARKSGVGVQKCTPTTKSGESSSATQGGSVDSVSASAAAQVCGVARRTVFNAKLVASKGAPELVAAVESGEVSISTAAELVELEPKLSKQREIVSRGKKAVAEAVKQLKAAQKPKAKPAAASGGASSAKPDTPGAHSGAHSAHSGTADAGKDGKDDQDGDASVAHSGTPAAKPGTKSGTHRHEGPILMKADFVLHNRFTTEIPGIDLEHFQYKQVDKAERYTRRLLLPIRYRDESIRRAKNGVVFESQKDKHGVYVKDASDAERYVDGQGRNVPRQLYPICRAIARRDFYWLCLVREMKPLEALEHMRTLATELGDHRMEKLADEFEEIIRDALKKTLNKLNKAMAVFEEGITPENYGHLMGDKEQPSA